MCEIDWEIIQKYVDSLIWPIVGLIVFFAFKKQIIILIKRITNESDNLDFGGFLKVQFREVEKIRESKAKGEDVSDSDTDSLISSTIALQIDGIKNLGEEYINSSYDQRRIIESRIQEYSIGLRVDDIESLMNSKETGHKIAAAISLEQILYKQKVDPADNQTVKLFITKSLKDKSSFLRYETLQLVFQSDKLKSELKETLIELRDRDKNKAIRGILKIYIK